MISYRLLQIPNGKQSRQAFKMSTFQESQNVKRLSPTANVGDAWDNTQNKAVKAFETPFTMKLAATDIWESSDAYSAWNKRQQNDKRTQGVRHVLEPVEASNADVPSAGDATPSICLNQRSLTMSKESPIDQRSRRSARKKWLRQHQRSVNRADSHFHSHGIKRCRKIDSTFGKVVIVDANEGIAGEDFHVSHTGGNVCGHPCEKRFPSARNKRLLI